MLRLTLLSAIVIGLGLISVDGFAGDPVGFPENHYQVYRVAGGPSVTGPIILRDQFGTTQHTFALLEKFANPTEKNFSPIYDPFFHHTWWAIDDPQPSRDVVVTNQFGVFTWTTKNGHYLLLPAAKNQTSGPPPDIMNHYKCYDATGPAVDLQVSLADQFVSTGVVGPMPRFLCNPVEKTYNDQVTPIVDPNIHLACYNMDPVPFDLYMFSADQFIIHEYYVREAQFFCVPSLKEEPTPNEESSWGELKSIYR